MMPRSPSMTKDYCRSSVCVILTEGNDLAEDKNPLCYFNFSASCRAQ